MLLFLAEQFFALVDGIDASRSRQAFEKGSLLLFWKTSKLLQWPLANAAVKLRDLGVAIVASPCASLLAEQPALHQTDLLATVAATHSILRKQRALHGNSLDRPEWNH